ncbi:MAG TPA: hypothetical protein VJ349_26470, partial [Stellaceae bacterium]|nr:hypothetical protein [Stellaceae bacterium]
SWITRVLRDLPLPKTPEEEMLASDPGNVGLRVSGRNALFGVYDMVREERRSGSTRRDRDPHFKSDTCGLGHIFWEQEQFDRGVLRREKSQRGEMS